MHDTDRLGQLILSQWLLHRPRMVAQLRARNGLDEAISQAQERTADLLYELYSVQKMEYQAAWELAIEDWITPEESSSTLSPSESRPATSG